MSYGNKEHVVVQVDQGLKAEVETLTTNLAQNAKYKSNLINVRQPPFNAKGDGTDDFTALRDAIEYAYTNGFKGVYFPKPPVKYSISDTLLLYSKQAYLGDGIGVTLIEQITTDKPVVASKNYYSSNGIAPSGRLRISEMTLMGDTTKTNNHGLLVRDYYSGVHNIEVLNVGGDGIKFVHLNDVGTTTGGTLVENRIEKCEVRNAKGYSYYVGESNNNKLTDGFFIDNIASASATTPAHVYIGSSAGWVLNGVHTYGSAPTDSIVLLNAYHTNVDNIYIEGFKSNGLNCQQLQRALNIGTISIKCSSAEANGKAISFGRSSLVSTATVNIGNLILLHEVQTSVYGVYSNTGTITIGIGQIQIDGNEVAFVTRYYSPDMTTIKRSSDFVVDGKVSESPNKIALAYENVRMPHYGMKRVTGNTAQTVDIPLSKILNFQKVIGTLQICANAFDNGAQRAVYEAQVMVSAKSNGTNAWTVYVNDKIAPVGFSVNPAVTATNTSGNDGKLTISFTFTSSDSTGVIGFIYTPIE
jgi:hypothetical protein